MKTTARVLLALILFAGLAGCASKPAAGKTAKFNLFQAGKIKPNMSYKEAVAALGAPGKIISQKDGIVKYRWRNRDGTYVILDYKDDQLVGADINMLKQQWKWGL